jgi:flagellar biosynthetic protein FliR
MTTVNLADFLSGHVFGYMLVFMRIGGAMMFFPGISETFVITRARFFFAAAISLVLYVPLSPTLPPMPPTTGGLTLLLMQETFVGVFFSALLRLLMDVLETAGSITSMQLGLSNAMMLNPSLATQSTLTSVFFGLAGIVLLFVTGLDHLLLRGLVETYTIFPAGTALPTGDVVQTYTRLMTKCFAVGVELAAPLLIVSLLLYAIMGFMQRLMPQIQLFLVVLPMQIWGGTFVLAVTVAAVLGVWLRFANDSFGKFFTGAG